MRKRLAVGLAAGGVVVATILVAAGVSSGGGVLGQPPSSSTSTAVAAPGSSQSAIAVDSPTAVAVGKVLAPYGYQVDGGDSVRGATRSLTNLTAKNIGDGVVTVTIYRIFDPRELTGAGLQSLSTASGTTWIGANDSELTAIYFLSSSGVGLHIASIERGVSGPVPTDRLGMIAQDLARDATIAAEAKS
jgi:hypothetical protein